MNKEIIIVLEMDHTPKKIKANCLKCETEFELIHQKGEKYKGKCYSCKQDYSTSKKKSIIRR